LDNVSISDTIKRYGKGKMKLILEIFSRSISTINNLNIISTGEMFRAQRNLFKGSKPVGYPKGGLNSITQKFADYIIKNGGEINLEKPVKKIIFKDKKAVGVLVKDKEIYFDIIISNILVQELFKIADEKYFPKDYVKNIKSLIGTGSLCAYHSLKKVDPSLIGKTFHFIERNIGIDGNDAVGMIDFMATCKDAGLSPRNQYLIQSYIICTPEEAKDKKILEKLKNLLEKNLKKLIPDYQENLNWVIYPAIWHLDGVAKTIYNEKPDIKTPIDNLYLVGDCVKSPGIGFNCALNSARILTKIINK
jgi:phytoene dehydrogenase-like protein